MTGLSRRLTAATAVVAGLTALVLAGPAWACVGVVSLTSNPSTVTRGGTLMVTGREFAAGTDVLIHLDTLNGPVLTTVPIPGMDTMTSKFTVAVPIPSDVQDGQHILVATQDAHDMNSGAPARSVFYVGPAAAAPTSPAAVRPAALAVDSGPSSAHLVLIGAAVAAALLVVFGLWSWIRRRGDTRSEA